MEIFTGDREITNSVAVFSDNLVPFPQGSDIISVYQSTKIQTPPNEQNLPPHPQKLRPIRCNGRTLPDYSYQTPPQTSGLDGTLFSCYGVRSSDLGFLSQLPTTQQLSGRVDDTSGAPALTESGGFPVNNGGFGNTINQIKTEFEDQRLNLISEGDLLDAELSSSSDDVSGGSAEASKEPSSQKRKRKTRKTVALALENMMTQLLEKQEQMHKHLMETLEMKEKERIMREEAFKLQEMEMAKRDEEFRAQERARSLALISFIENLLGIEIPVVATPSSMEKDEEGEINIIHGQDLDPSNKKRWPKSEVQALITVRSALEENFIKGPKNSVWEEVAVRLANMGYSRTAKKCKEKWENINKYYKRTVESGKKRAENSTTCPYFQELDFLYKSGLIASENPSKIVKVETQHNECESVNERSTKDY